MANTLYWQPIESEHTIDGPQESIAESLQKVFGEFPLVLTGDHIRILEGMAAVYTAKPNPYQQLINALMEHIEILITLEASG